MNTRPSDDRPSPHGSDATREPTDAPSPFRLGAAELAVIGLATFVSGFFVLAVAGRALPIASHLLVLGGGLALAAPLGVLMLVVAASEAVAGRAWATGFRRLEPRERGRRGIGERAGRYAGFLWFANGVALWFATMASLV